MIAEEFLRRSWPVRPSLSFPSMKSSRKFLSADVLAIFANPRGPGVALFRAASTLHFSLRKLFSQPQNF